MAIDAATVRRVAHLARIKTPEDRLEPLAAELNGILNWIEQLNEVDVDGVEPMTSNVHQPLRLRDDIVTEDRRLIIEFRMGEDGESDRVTVTPAR